MGLFTKKPEPVALPPKKEPISKTGYAGLNGSFQAREDKVWDEISKSYSLNDYQTTRYDDQGGYFGNEFDLRTTAGRMKQLYAREPWVYATASLIARTLAGVEFKVRDKVSGETIEGHPLERIIMGGNADQDGRSLNWAGYLDLILGGNFFKVLDKSAQIPVHIPVELVDLVLRDPEKTKPGEIARKGMIEAIQVYSTWQGAAVSGKPIPYDQVVHFKMPNPFTAIFGMSLFSAAARPILLDRHKNEFEMAFYLRGASNAGVIETTEDITKSRMERLMSTFEQAFTGKRNWWRTLFLPKGAKWVNSGLTMAEMEHLEGLRENRRSLLATIGVPPSQVGIVEDVNRATAEVQERAFWQNTIIPLVYFIEAGYNGSDIIKREYGGGVEVYGDLSGIEAVEGSLTSRGETAKALDDIATINEQREIVGLPPRPDGDVYVSQLGVEEYDKEEEKEDVEEIEEEAIEISLEAGEAGHTHKAVVLPTGDGETTDEEEMGHSHTLRGTENEDGTVLVTVGEANDGHTHPDFVFTPPAKEEEEEEAVKEFGRVKATVVVNQERLEKTRGNKYLGAVERTIDRILAQAEKGLTDGVNVRVYLQSLKSERSKAYSLDGLPILGDTMVRGFDLGNATKKSVGSVSVKASYRFTPEDELAIEILKERTESGKRKTLAERNILAFAGFDETQTENIMKIIDKGLEEGKTTDQIAATIRATYGESYGDQAFTVARTETLTAVSEGLVWHQDTLKTVFSKVDKRWLHVGDIGVNPDARAPHGGFETLGQVSSDYVYENEKTGARLAYPRDPRGGAKDVINCRCSMVSVVPSDATSNAGAILENA